MSGGRNEPGALDVRGGRVLPWASTGDIELGGSGSSCVKSPRSCWRSLASAGP